MTQEVDQKQRILKAVVIILGVLLLLCFVIVAVTIASRLAKMGKDDALETKIVEEIVVTPDFGDKEIQIPKGARIDALSADGDTLFVVVEGPEGQKILVIDHWTGRERGRINLVPKAE